MRQWLNSRMLTTPAILIVVVIVSSSALADPYVVNVPLVGGTIDWLGDARFQNFRDTAGELNVDSEYEMLISARSNRSGTAIEWIDDGTLTRGDLPGGSNAMWAENNSFWISYDPGTDQISLRLVGSGRTSYDVTISREADQVAGPLNYIEFELYDRDAFRTIPGGLTLSDLDGFSLGTFSIANVGWDSWAILDPGGATLNDGFVLHGSFTVDPALLLDNPKTDRISFGIGSHSLVPDLVAPVPAPGAAILGLLGLSYSGWRLRRRGD